MIRARFNEKLNTSKTMSNTKTNGGPAFPVPLSEHQTMASHHANGMTLRDYFAAKAMQGILSSPHMDDEAVAELNTVALAAYEMADAMLKAREQ